MQQVDDVSFYRQLDPTNNEHYHKFPNQTINPLEAVHEDVVPYFGKENMQPDLHAPDHRDFLTNLLDLKSLKKFKKTSKNFEESENLFFDAITYGLMFYKSEGKIVDKSKIKELLGEDFCNDLLKVKEQIKLDRMIFGYFNRCFKVN